MIELARSSDPRVLTLLRSHTRVQTVEEGGQGGIEFIQYGRVRSVRVNDPSAELRGLVELMDNNPLVCGDHVSVPGPTATLGLIALAPLALAGLLTEEPTLISNDDSDDGELAALLAESGWPGVVIISHEVADLGGAVAATAMAEIANMEDFEEIDALYEERYSRSFFVHRDEDADWHVQLVLGKADAYYRLRLTPGVTNSLLTIQVMADANGKCGAAQLVHCMNVMAGFEESLGI